MTEIRSATNKSLNIVLKNTNRALKEVLKDASPKDLATLQQAKDLGSILESLLKNTASSKLQNQELLQMLKNNPTLKSLGNVTTTLKEFEQLLQKTDPQDKTLQKLHSIISEKLSGVDQLNGKALKKNLQNSGVFLESKLKDATISKDLLSNDLKAALNKSLESLQNSATANQSELLKHLDKLSLQIDYYQLLSHLSDKSVLYIPYSFDALEDGSISIKSAKNKKFFCDINLKLTEYGELDLRLGLFEKNQLNINIRCQSQELKSILQTNLPLLKKQLFQADLYPKDIRFLDKEEDENLQKYQSDMQSLELGFEVKA